MVVFSRYLRERSHQFHNLDELTLYNRISKDGGLSEYYKSLIGDRQMFVEELKDLAKKEKLKVEDYNKIYLRFAQFHDVFDEE